METDIQPDDDLDLSYLGMVKHPKTNLWVWPKDVKFYTQQDRIKKRLLLKKHKAVIQLMVARENGYRSNMMLCPRCGGIVRGAMNGLFCSDCDWESDVI